MTRDQILAAIKPVASKQFMHPEVMIEERSHMIEDLGGDSMDAVEFVFGLEETFDLEITDADAEHLKTIGDAVDLIVRLKGSAA